ncbi:copper resistance CopC family protein [Antribacter gilvus]|uniref:copper resistance CopC family protein n=1 Tax=Antribacter gilvus TaxID=2304675 RepID=UPI000F793F8A|nr:copper resistance protein CopC [Antribacter gilvus]
MPAVSLALPQPRVPARLLALAAAFVALTVVTVLGLVVGAQPAAAHDRLLSSEPADGQSVEAPESILLTFSSAPLETGAQLAITGPDGAAVDAEAPVVDAAGASVEAALPAGLPGGAYTVAWHVVSSDGHPIEGTFGFTVSAAEPEASPAPETEVSETSSGEAGTEVAGEADDLAVVPGAPDGGTASPLLLGLALLAALAVVIASVVVMRRKIMENEDLREASRRAAEEAEEPPSATDDDGEPPAKA